MDAAQAQARRSSYVTTIVEASLPAARADGGRTEYVQIKPILVLVTVISKATGTYREGKFAVDSGYTYVSIVYNTSICLSL